MPKSYAAYEYEYGHAHSPAPRGIYRSRHGILFGVCRGLADYFDLSVFWARVIVLLGIISTGFLPGVLLYVLAALVMKPDPGYR